VARSGGEDRIAAIGGYQALDLGRHALPRRTPAARIGLPRSAATKPRPRPARAAASLSGGEDRLAAVGGDQALDLGRRALPRRFPAARIGSR
jgi:hypothetical protein